MARSVFYDLADTPEEAASLHARSLLMIALEERIKEKGWTQTEAANALHVTQPRVSDLVTGKLHKFSLDALVNMLPAVGLTFDVRPAPVSAARRPVGTQSSKLAPVKRAAAKKRAQKASVSKKVAAAAARKRPQPRA